MQGQPAFSVLAHVNLSGSTHFSCHYKWSFIILHAQGCIGFMIKNFMNICAKLMLSSKRKN